MWNRKEEGVFAMEQRVSLIQSDGYTSDPHLPQIESSHLQPWIVGTIGLTELIYSWLSY